MADYKIGDAHSGAAYDGDNPLRLAKEIDATLDKYGLGNKRRSKKDQYGTKDGAKRLSSRG